MDKIVRVSVTDTFTILGIFLQNFLVKICEFLARLDYRRHPPLNFKNLKFSKNNDNHYPSSLYIYI